MTLKCSVCEKPAKYIIQLPATKIHACEFHTFSLYFSILLHPVVKWEKVDNGQ